MLIPEHCNYLTRDGKICGDESPWKSGFGYHWCAVREEEVNPYDGNALRCPLNLWKLTSKGKAVRTNYQEK